MQIAVTVRHTSVTEEIKTYAVKKAERLLKYYDRIQEIRVLLDVAGPGYLCEMILDLEHMHDLVVRTEGTDWHAIIDETVDRMERQLIEHKDRIRNRKGRGPNPHQPTRT